jgi:Xaa-Pro aminopeptidase
LIEFIRNRSRGFATPIASGNNANVLHYIENNQQCKAGDLILLDVAAEYANSSDMSRTIRFQAATLRDKEVTMPC